MHDIAKRLVNVARQLLAAEAKEAKLVPPLRDVGRFAKSVEESAAALSAAHDTLADARDDAPDFSYVDRQLPFDLDDLRSAVYQANRLAETAERHAYSIKNCRNWERSQMIAGAVERLTEGLETESKRLRQVAATTWDQIDEVVKDTSYDPALVVVLKQTVQAAAALVKRVAYGIAGLQAALDIMSPKPDDLEVLYHASVRARELSVSGFSDKHEGRGFGLGGSIADKAGNDAISFTYDVKYALEIARWFKEMAMVAAGDITPTQILTWAKKEGIAEDVMERFASLYGAATQGNLFKGGVERLIYRDGEWKFIHLQFSPEKNEVVETPGDPDLIFKNAKDTYGLYFAYITFSKHRTNPVNFNTANTLEQMAREKIDPRDIGVVAAEVDMTDPDIGYMPGELEYRVQPRSIKRIVKFIGS